MMPDNTFYLYIPVSNFSDNYHYRAFLTDFLDNSEDVKRTQLSSQGWDSDKVGYFDSSTNGGWLNRRSRFLKYDKSGNDKLTMPPFRSDGATFIGKLKTNMEYCRQGLVPYTSVMIEITFSPEDFPIWSPSGVSTDYMLFYEKCTLFVAVGQLNKDINLHLEHHLARKAAIYYYRELRCVGYPIMKNTVHYVSPDLQAPTQATIKVYIAFVLRAAYMGDQHLNP